VDVKRAGRAVMCREVIELVEVWMFVVAATKSTGDLQIAPSRFTHLAQASAAFPLGGKELAWFQASALTRKMTL
jgi:hypothetical protein